MKRVTVLCCLCLLCGCISTMSKAPASHTNVDRPQAAAVIKAPVRLTNVDRPQAAVEKFGQAKITEDGDSYEDGLLTATWSFSLNGFVIRISNKTTQPIRIEWDNSSFVDAAGNAHRLVRGDVVLMNTSLAQAPISIPAGASLSQTLCCPDGIIRVGSSTLVFLPYNDRKSAINNISVMIPFEIEGQKEVYTFAFHILDTKEIQDISAQQKK